MIARLTGKIVHQELDHLIIDVHGVGYLVHVPLGISGFLNPNESGDVSMIIHTSVREDAIQLFGFGNARQKLLFHKLTGISGVGPKLAMAVLSDMEVDEVLEAVLKEDVKRFTKVSGVGKKTAQRLLLELKSAVDEIGFSRTPSADAAKPASAGDEALLDDLRSALSNLGYKPNQVEDAIDKLQPIPEDINSIEPLLRKALRFL